MVVTTDTFSCAGKKNANEDALIVETCADGAVCLALADGMGGHDAGRLASHTAIKAVQKWCRAGRQTGREELFLHIVELLRQASQKNGTSLNLGTTLTICVLADNMASVAHVGDCRIYHLRGKGLVSRTEDQTELHHLLRERIISREQAKNYPRPNVLLSALSPRSDFTIYDCNFEVQAGDIIMLCSDGVHRVINKPQIRSIADQCQDVSGFVGMIKAYLDNAKPKDDYSVIAAYIDDSSK
ncbi:protein serine/threonine phosphatase [Salinisphaera sp. PC39]|uniref:PP2C family protein-serine/threonine phosphatase n=1 Tax=Salinisphaera sp. PC39 TaxID=1304156 RepID=UPI0033408D17